MLQQWALLRVPHVPVQSIAEHSCLSQNFQGASIEQGPRPNADATFNIQRQFLSEKLENHCSLMLRLNQSTYQLQPSIRVQDSPSPARHSLSPVKRSGTSEIPQKGGSWWNQASETQRRVGMEKSSPGKGHEQTSCFMAAKKPISRGEKG